MKHRVIKKGDLFYPQYKSWLFGWCHFTEVWGCIDGTYGTSDIYFRDIESAIKFLPASENKIVWESI